MWWLDRGYHGVGRVGFARLTGFPAFALRRMLLRREHLVSGFDDLRVREARELAKHFVPAQVIRATLALEDVEVIRAFANDGDGAHVRPPPSHDPGSRSTHPCSRGSRRSRCARRPVPGP